MVALLAVWPMRGGSGFDLVLWTLATAYVLIVVVSGLLSIALKDGRRQPLQQASRSLYHLTSTFGGPRDVFSAVFLFAIFAFHRNEPREYLTIGACWAIVVALRPLERISSFVAELRQIWGARSGGDPLGEVVGHLVPGIVLIKHDPSCAVKFGDTLVVPGEDGKANIALALDHVGLADGRWLRAVQLDLPWGVRNEVCKSAGEKSNLCRILKKEQLERCREGIHCEMLERRDSLVGLVAPDTDISRLRFEIVRCDLDLEEGRLLEVGIGAKPVLYQVVNGLTREEIVQEKNKRGYVRGEAKKIGRWNTSTGGFDVVKWLPSPNAPVFLVGRAEMQPRKEAVGHFPGTDYPVSLDIHQLVVHNGAVLGILGVGKSFLAIELVERMIAEKIKVICLDLTNQYANELSQFYDARDEEREIKELQALGPQGRGKVSLNVEEGGSVGDFTAALRQKLEPFLQEGSGRYLKIFNPASFEIWRQDSKPYQNKASMASLTPTEVTRIFAEVTLEILQEKGMTDVARCCLVFEEAHSLIPEWTAVATEGDKSATNGTAKAILQGRKFGLGCLVVTQRTANVTKSILNQCNTIFALRSFDATGIEFLKNYIGEDYAAVISTLEDRHAVIFGRASSCRDPVLVRLNEREDFLRVFREAREEGESHDPQGTQKAD